MSYYHDMMTWVLQGGPIFFLCESVCADGPILRCVLFQICHAVDKGTFLLDIRPHVAHYVKYTSSMLWIVLATNPLFKHPCLFFNRAYPPPAGAPIFPGTFNLHWFSKEPCLFCQPGFFCSLGFMYQSGHLSQSP